jgi:hypothetical protein
LQIAKKWRGTSAETDWIIKHGCRTLLKRGDEAILHLHGFNPSKACQKQEVPKKVTIGENLQFSFTFVSEENKSTLFRLEYAIDYLTRTGKISKILS